MLIFFYYYYWIGLNTLYEIIKLGTYTCKYIKKSTSLWLDVKKCYFLCVKLTILALYSCKALLKKTCDHTTQFDVNS